MSLPVANNSSRAQFRRGRFAQTRYNVALKTVDALVRERTVLVPEPQRDDLRADLLGALDCFCAELTVAPAELADLVIQAWEDFR